MRVNARFDADAEVQVMYLAQATGLGVSEVLRTSVQHYYDAVRAQRGGLKHLSAFIGAGDSGRIDVGSTYKQRLSESWSAKHVGNGEAWAVHESQSAWPATGAQGGKSAQTVDVQKQDGATSTPVSPASAKSKGRA